ARIGGGRWWAADAASSVPGWQGIAEAGGVVTQRGAGTRRRHDSQRSAESCCGSARPRGDVGGYPSGLDERTGRAASALFSNLASGVAGAAESAAHVDSGNLFPRSGEL